MHVHYEKSWLNLAFINRESGAKYEDDSMGAVEYPDGKTESGFQLTMLK